MNKYILPSGSILVLLLLLFLHSFGTTEYWYVSFPYLDIVNHFLGGIGLAMAILWITKNPRYTIPLTIIAGIIWEIFEVYYNITGWPIGSMNYKLDTLKDLIMDTIGAVTVWFIFKNKKNNES